MKPPVLVDGLSLRWALATLYLLTAPLLVGIASMLLVDGLEEPCSGDSASGEATGGLGTVGLGTVGLATGSGESTDVESDVDGALTLFFACTFFILFVGSLA